jgi:4-hydroxy-4-methyl-2-oxoglutarate aldolase
VTVEPGDLVVADADGVVVVPADIAASVIGEARAGRAKEQEARRRLSEGGSAQEVLGDLGVL